MLIPQNFLKLNKLNSAFYPTLHLFTGIISTVSDPLPHQITLRQTTKEIQSVMVVFSLTPHPASILAKQTKFIQVSSFSFLMVIIIIRRQSRPRSCWTEVCQWFFCPGRDVCDLAIPSDSFHPRSQCYEKYLNIF